MSMNTNGDAQLSEPGVAPREQVQANAQHEYEVTAADLPLSCPMPAMRLWNSHPRVYLAIEDGWAKCSYCGAEYTLRR